MFERNIKMQFWMARHTAVFTAAMICQMILWLFLGFCWLIFVKSHILVLLLAFAVFVVASVLYSFCLIVSSFTIRSRGWVDESRKENLMAYNLAVLRIFKGEMDAIDGFAFAASICGSFFIGIIMSSYITADFIVRNHKRIVVETV